MNDSQELLCTFVNGNNGIKPTRLFKAILRPTLFRYDLIKAFIKLIVTGQIRYSLKSNLFYQEP